MEFDEDLEQLDFLNVSSQGEEVSQSNVGAEENLKELGSELKTKQYEPESSEKSIEEQTGNNIAKNMGKNANNKTVKVDEGEEQFFKNQEEMLKAVNSKFKSVNDLSKAYDNLQSDYTKKCQTLALLQKEVEDNKAKALPEIYNGALWQQKRDEFFNNNSNAKEFESEILKIATSNNEILKSNNPFENAWRYYKEQNFLSKKSLAEDDEFVNSYILNNKKIKEKIINDYFSSINLQSSPSLISAKGSSRAVVTAEQKPKSIKEASKLVEDLL